MEIWHFRIGIFRFVVAVQSNDSGLERNHDAGDCENLFTDSEVAHWPSLRCPRVVQGDRLKRRPLTVCAVFSGARIPIKSPAVAAEASLADVEHGRVL